MKMLKDEKSECSIMAWLSQKNNILRHKTQDVKK